MNFNHHKARLYMVLGFIALVLLWIFFRRNSTVIASQSTNPPQIIPVTTPEYLTYNVPKAANDASNLPTVSDSGNLPSSNLPNIGCGCGSDAAGGGLLSSFNALQQNFADAANSTETTYLENVISAMPVSFKDLINNPLGDQLSVTAHSFFTG